MDSYQQIRLQEVRVDRQRQIDEAAESRSARRATDRRQQAGRRTRGHLRLRLAQFAGRHFARSRTIGSRSGEPLAR
jgi:hypothetical protein